MGYALVHRLLYLYLKAEWPRELTLAHMLFIFAQHYNLSPIFYPFLSPRRRGI